MWCLQMRDGDAPSYYNPVEASTLVKLLQGLLSYKTGGGQAVTVKDIGVIATYRNQASFEAKLWLQIAPHCHSERTCDGVLWLSQEHQQDSQHAQH